MGSEDEVRKLDTTKEEEKLKEAGERRQRMDVSS